MQTQKMRLANIKEKLSRAEMKNVNGGVVPMQSCTCDGGSAISVSCFKSKPCGNSTNYLCNTSSCPQP